MKIGLTLSGGGTRGVFHIGVLKAMEELKIFPSIVSGTSAGALVGTLYAAGVPIEFILQEAKSVRWFHFLGARIPKSGLTDLRYVRQLLEKYIPENRFESLKIPIWLAATNMNLGEAHLFHTGPLFEAVQASCAVPFLFEPVTIQDQIFMDGGITMNLPVTPIVPYCDIIIASNLIPIDKNLDIAFNGLVKKLTRILEISIDQNTKIQRPFANILIETNEICQYKRYDLTNPQALYDLGYKTGLKVLETKVRDLT
ncbi:MAG: patatin-like phospholipase family protein [Saprospiraceae bacterium]|nr:patatin-like phospholipase family protein [Saprospiraceae bacterium]